MTKIAVPVERPKPRTEQLDLSAYVGRHRLPGVETVKIRPDSLSEADGPTAQLDLPSGWRAAAKFVLGLGRP
jgi:hypothetical protein